MTAKKTILVVEDEPVVAFHLRVSAENWGFSPVVVDTGEKAVEFCFSKMPAVVFMDIRLKGRMSGLDAAAAIRQAHHDARIIFLTAYADPVIIGKIVDLGCPYLAKPFDENELKTLIQKLL